MIVGTAGFTAAMSVIALQEHGVYTRPRAVAGHGRHRRGRVDGGRDAGRARLRGRGEHRQGRRRGDFLHALGASTVIEHGRASRRGIDAAARVNGLGRCRRLCRRSGTLANVLKAHPLRRFRRRQRPHRRQRPAGDSAAVHPSRRQAARDRLGADADRSSPRCGERSAATSSRPGWTDRARRRSRRSRCRARRHPERRGDRPHGRRRAEVVMKSARPAMLSHVAYITRDTAATADFYTGPGHGARQRGARRLDPVDRRADPVLPLVLPDGRRLDDRVLRGARAAARRRRAPRVRHVPAPRAAGGHHRRRRPLARVARRARRRGARPRRPQDHLQHLLPRPQRCAARDHHAHFTAGTTTEPRARASTNGRRSRRGAPTGATW